jgi:hypothetical protein
VPVIEPDLCRRNREQGWACPTRASPPRPDKRRLLVNYESGHEAFLAAIGGGCREKKCSCEHLTTALRTDSLCGSLAASHDRTRIQGSAVVDADECFQRCTGSWPAIASATFRSPGPRVRVGIASPERTGLSNRGERATVLPLGTRHPVLVHLERLVFPEDALASAGKAQLVGCGVLSLIGRRIPCGTTKRSPKHAGRKRK